ncbi:MAG: hypothetical protein ABI716_03055 [Candidatus Saccharibacteria bacterium]
METIESDVESVTMTDILRLSTWNRQRETSELIGFIAAREAMLSDDVEV